MRRFTLLLLLLLLGLSPQNNAEYFDMNEISYGIQGGFNLSNIGGDQAVYPGTTDALETRVGMMFGGTGKYVITRELSVVTELNYSERGAVYKQNGVDYSVQLNYLDLPISVVYLIPELSRDLHIKVSAGVQGSYLLSGEVKNKTTVVDTTKDATSAYATLDFGVFIGVNVGFTGPFGDGDWSAGLRFYQGMNEIADKQSGSAFQIGLGYHF